MQSAQSEFCGDQEGVVPQGFRNTNAIRRYNTPILTMKWSEVKNIFIFEVDLGLLGFLLHLTSNLCKIKFLFCNKFVELINNEVNFD